MKKKILPVMLLVLVAVQFIRPERNISNDLTNDISKTFPVSDSVQVILKKACYDCHSNNTIYPWYANVQPVASWLAHHVDDGKKHLNFSDFLNYPVWRQYHKLEEVEEVLTDDAEEAMPLFSYTLIHRDAVLTEHEKMTLVNWSLELRDSLKVSYPADSLVNPKKRK